MTCNPKALLVTIVAIALLWYAVENERGVVAVIVNALLTWALWTMLWPNRWFVRRQQPR